MNTITDVLEPTMMNRTTSAFDRAHDGRHAQQGDDEGRGGSGGKGADEAAHGRAPAGWGRHGER